MIRKAKRRPKSAPEPVSVPAQVAELPLAPTKRARQILRQDLDKTIRQAKKRLEKPLETPFSPHVDMVQMQIDKLRKERLEQGKSFAQVTEEEMREEIAKNQANGSRKLSPEEKLVILDLYAGGIPPKIIARHLERTIFVVQGFLSQYRSTVPMARLALEAGAEKLANRVIDRATVTESLEVLDRMDVLPKKRDVDTSGSSRFQVVVGVVTSGSPEKGIPAIPIPSQAQIEAAKEPQDNA